jgi:cell division protein FtsW
VTRLAAERRTWTRPDFAILACVAILIVVGLNMVYSASYVLAHNDPSYGDDAYFLVQQAERAAVGIILLLILQNVDYHALSRISAVLLVATFALLVFVLVSHFAHSAYGAQRWLKFGSLPPIEPSEVAKLSLVVYFADWLSRRTSTIRDFHNGTLPIGLVTSVVCALVILQPDLGTATVIALTSLSMYFVAGADLRHLLAGLVAGSATFFAVVIGAGYRSQRLAAFLDASQDPLGVGWNITQAQIALGSGGIFGLGLGASRQKYYYLPNAHTDAIFAVVGEELGLIGTVGVLVIFCVLAIRGARVALRAPDAFGMLLATGITTGLVVQALINVGVITAMIPFTGVPLPFLSYGGSSLMASLASIGILLNVSRQSPGLPEPRLPIRRGAIRTGEPA